MTTVYFIRHAESDRSIQDTRERPLTAKGLADAEKLAALFTDTAIHRIYASPYKRAVDTVAPLAESRKLDITRVENLRERDRDSVESMGMEEKILLQWNDFSYVPMDGECYLDVQQRNLNALRGILAENEGQTVVIGTHGIAMCTTIHFFSPIGHKQLRRILLTMPYVTRLMFDKDRFIEISELPLTDAR